MSARWPLPFVLVLGVAATRTAGPTVTIDTASPSGRVSPLFYGLMTEEIFAKLVNASDADAPVEITLTGTGSLASTATALTLSADPRATNTIDTPERVVPVRSTVTGVESGFTYTVPKHGIVVLTTRTR
jgi:alpha-L-arabinofuranosidase